jgi:type IX secretion system substrate protein
VKQTILLFLFFSFCLKSYTQFGCTDPQALNYDSDALINDGSCSYGLTEYTLTEVTVLPEELRECSGIELLDSGLWIHNDAGNEDKIYRIDSISGQILQSVIIATADNIDWEDIAEDETHIYIGDFGNNAGNRTNLRIYKINKSDLSNTVINADLIEFSYSDQVDFSENINNNDFDCEAFIFYNDSLHLFTKNWVDNQTKHYVVPAEPGNHSATLVESFNTFGLVTGADISNDNKIVLIGYTEIGLNFMWLLFDFHDNLFFSGNKRSISLGFAGDNGQTEGITIDENGRGYVCSEEFVVGPIYSPQKILSFSIKQWVDNPTSIQELDETYQTFIFPNPFQDFLQIEISRPVDIWRLYDSNGRVIKTSREPVSESLIKINTDNLPAGRYYFEIEKANQSKVFQTVKY